MKKAINISEIIEAIDLPEGPCEVCASANAQYDERRERLLLRLDSFIRTTDLRISERHPVATWLPKAHTLEKPVAPEEAVTVSKDIFRLWVQRVRRGIPDVSNSQPGGKGHVTEIHR